MAIGFGPIQKKKRSKLIKGNISFQKKNPLQDFFFYAEELAGYPPFSSATLTLQNGFAMPGVLSQYTRLSVQGEVVFTTGMVGYVETLTDPSYAGQIIVFTYPLIGNYGIPDKKYWEHNRIAARGVIISEACFTPSHYLSKDSLFEWLRGQNIPLFLCSDTRALTKVIREYGTPLGVIRPLSKAKEKLPTAWDDPAKTNLIAEVSVSKEKIYGSGKKTIIAVDCGMKENIIRELLLHDVKVIRVPYHYDYTREAFDGIFLSNGPGDPAMARDTISILKKAFTMKKPIFGICLGSQLMGIAAGGRTYKLPYGHRGQNQPCQNIQTGQCFMTSQNHGYAVKEDSLRSDWMVTYRNLNDGSVEGIAHKKLPFFSVQFHPEASPGPTDTRFLFEKFLSLL